MEVEEVKLDPFESNEVKKEPQETKSLGSLSMWNLLVKRSRYLYKVEGGQEAKLNRTKLASLLLDEVENLLEEVACFVQACCDAQHQGDSLEGVRLKDRVSFGLFGDKNVQVHFNPFVQNEVFDPLDQDLVHLEQILPSFNFLPPPQPPPPLPPPNLNDSSDDNEENDRLEAELAETGNDAASSSPDKFSQYPRPKIVPVDYNKKKQVCVCEQCGGSWSRKEYYYHHKSVGKCTPKWIRYSAKNKNRIRCVHPDCEDKKDVNFTYAGIMKHIIELHTSQETATLPCPDCDLKFPMKAVLKFHQDSVHQAHAMICTICGKIVRDMRKHKLVHSGEKPFQCDRCSYRCSRSGTLRRHMATHLNSNDPVPPAQAQVKTETDNMMVSSNVLEQQPSLDTTTPQASLDTTEHVSNTLQLEQQIPIHIAHHEATDLPQPKFIELSTQQLAQHLPPHSTYGNTVQATLPTVTYREFKFQ